MFDEDDFHCDCGGDEGEHYGCSLCECCEDCPHMFECDGCGNLIYRDEDYAPSPLPRKTKESSFSVGGEKKPENGQKSAKSSPKRNTAIAIGVIFLLACLLISLFI